MLYQKDKGGLVSRRFSGHTPIFADFSFMRACQKEQQQPMWNEIKDNDGGECEYKKDFLLDDAFS